MKLSLKSRLKVLATGNIDEYRAAFLSGEDIPTEEIGSEIAMKYSAVNACIRVLAETFASAPMILYKKNKDGRDPATDLLIYDILHDRPNEEMASYTFDVTRMANLCIGGNSVCQRLVNKSGELVGLYPYSHSVTQISRNKETKKLEYKIGTGPDAKIFKRGEVLHIPNMSFDGVIGLSPLTYAAETIRLGLSYEQYGINFYQNAAMPSGVFENPNNLSDVAYARLKKELKENYTGLRKSGTPMILEEGMKWNQVTVNPIDAQLIESKYFQIEDIARIYRVPQHMINKLDRSTNNNIEEQALEFVMYTMLPYFKRDESSVNTQLLTPEQRTKDGYYFERKVDGLLRGDAASRATAYATGRQWGYLCVDDIRKLENMTPLPDGKGQIYLQPSNMVEAGSNQANTVNARLIEEIYNMIEGRR